MCGSARLVPPPTPPHDIISKRCEAAALTRLTAFEWLQQLLFRDGYRLQFFFTLGGVALRLAQSSAGNFVDQTCNQNRCAWTAAALAFV